MQCPYHVNLSCLYLRTLCHPPVTMGDPLTASRMCVSWQWLTNHCTCVCTHYFVIMCASVCAHVCVCACVCLRARVPVCLCVCVCVHAWMSVFVCGGGMKEWIHNCAFTDRPMDQHEGDKRAGIISSIVCFCDYRVNLLSEESVHWISIFIATMETRSGIQCKDLRFLVACTQLYKPLCRLVGPLVGPSVAVHEARDLWQSALLFLCPLVCAIPILILQDVVKHISLFIWKEYKRMVIHFSIE